MLRGFFVTGTDTGVGKTVVAAALLHRYRADGPIRYWKPIQTGIERNDDTAEAGRLAACQPDEVLASGVRLPRPLAPHLAARLSGSTIALQPLLDSIRAEPASVFWIVEGAGGVLVPINDSETMIDLMTHLQLAIVVVARTSLGTINHTLLTLEAACARGLRVLGVVIDHGCADLSAADRRNLALLIERLPVPLLCELAFGATRLPASFDLAAFLASAGNS